MLQMFSYSFNKHRGAVVGRALCQVLGMNRIPSPAVEGPIAGLGKSGWAVDQVGSGGSGKPNSRGHMI